MIETPKETNFKSFNNIFNHYYEITYKIIERFIDFEIEIILNGKYSRDQLTPG
jgi:hypothetical protein